MKYDGKFGKYGGVYVPELLIPAIEELEEAFYKFKDNKDFTKELYVNLQVDLRDCIMLKIYPRNWDVKYI